MNRSLTSVLVTLILICCLSTGSVFGQEEDTTAVILSFDDIDEEPASPPGPKEDKIHFSGRFDVNLEIANPADEEPVTSIKNYHKFLFAKVTPLEGVTLDVELLNLSYYELKLDVNDRIGLAVGKIWVPFGASPFHHYYGGRQGDPFTGELVPNVWAEFGAKANIGLYYGENVSLAGDLYVMRGYSGELGKVLELNTPGVDGRWAYGSRLMADINNSIAVSGSALHQTFGADNDGKLWLWGGDVVLNYGTFDVPFLKDLKLRAAFARAEIQDRVLVDEDNNSDYWYFRYGDYAELSYRGLPYVEPRVRYGTIIDFDDEITNANVHNWELALMSRIQRHFLILAQYQFNMEQINEVPNDLFRLQIAFEF